MENLAKQIEVLNNLFEVCEELKSKSYAVTFWKNELKIQGRYSPAILQLMKAEHGFEFNVKESGFVEAQRNFYDFSVEIVLT